MKNHKQKPTPGPSSCPSNPVCRVSRLVLLAVAAMSAATAYAQVSLSAIPYTQNFDTLGASGSWVDDSTVTGWYAAYNESGVVTLHTAYSGTAGGGTQSSALYSMGTGSSDPERSLGGAPASTRSTLVALRLVNDTGTFLDDLQITYDLEQWSTRGEASVTMSYQVFAPGTGSLLELSGWNPLATTVSPLPTDGTGWVNGIGNTDGLVAGITGGVSSLGLQSGDELWIRWSISKITGQNATHGIDNVVVAVPEPSAAALLGLGLLALARRMRPARLQ